MGKHEPYEYGKAEETMPVEKRTEYQSEKQMEEIKGTNKDLDTKLLRK